MGRPLYSSQVPQAPPSPTPSPTPTLPTSHTSSTTDGIHLIIEERADDSGLWTALRHFYDHYHEYDVDAALTPHSLVNNLLSTHLNAVTALTTQRHVIAEARAFAEALDLEGQQELVALARAVATQARCVATDIEDALDACEDALIDAGLVYLFRRLFPSAFQEQPAVVDPAALQRTHPGQPRPLAGTIRRRSSSPDERRVRQRRDSDVEGHPPTSPLAATPPRPNTPPRNPASPLSPLVPENHAPTGMANSPPPLPIPPPGTFAATHQPSSIPFAALPRPVAYAHVPSTSAALHCGFCLGVGHDYIHCPLWICPGCHIAAPGHHPHTCPDPRHPRTWNSWAALYQSPGERVPTPRPIDSISILRWPDGPRPSDEPSTDDDAPME